MPLSKRYTPSEVEPRLQEQWQRLGLYHFSPDENDPVYSVDTPPPTVSGNLHLGHVYSYSQPDFMARFWRMRGKRVFYPMGFDDNGLPTERLVEKRMGITAAKAGKQAFIETCLQVSEAAEQEYRAVWQRLGLSIDWRYTYRTIEERSQRISQYSFIDLYRKGLVYRREAPAIWCPECQTAISQAELNDLERQSEFITLPFRLENGQDLPVATTRPELLPACVALFVHPEDPRYQGLAGQQATVPLFGQSVPLLPDSGADPQKGTGAVMCCTFGDQADVAWWHTHHLPLIEALDRQGRMTQAAGEYAGLPSGEARRRIKQDLQAAGLVLNRQPAAQSVRVHERCDTPVEYVVTSQWFVRVLDEKEAFLQEGGRLAWHPAHMQSRYRAWVENLSWDWCISRQRAFGVPFPVWYCRACGEVILAGESQLPVDPSVDSPAQPCPACGGADFLPETDVLDTWATSSLTPQIVGGWDIPTAITAQGAKLYSQVFPFSLRPQAHEIIRTWAFYTLVKSHYHFDALPWKEVLISGWGVAGEGMEKISKSRGGGPMAPLEAMQRYSADALRYWAASTAAGKDAVISEEKISMGAKLVTKLWNVARFSQRFLEGYQPPAGDQELPASLTPADRWILSRLQRLIERVTQLMESYEYASAKSEIETFFWTELADNYLEMAKQRLYDEAHPQRQAAHYSLFHALLIPLKLLAPFLPYVTDEIYLGLFAGQEKAASIHVSAWPQAHAAWRDPEAERLGEKLVEIATAVRRYKSERNLPLAAELDRLQLAAGNSELAGEFQKAESDLMSVTRARRIEVGASLDPALEMIQVDGGLAAAIQPA